MKTDIIFLHPPAVYDFRKRATFPGVIAHTVRETTDQFIIFPIGLLSMAEYAARNGYRAAIDNVGERMIESEEFDPESYVAKIDARIFAIDLHWCTHSQGAVEVARFVKRLHPNSLVILGGLTATCFHEEIVANYPFIDGVIRGEAEEPLLQLLQALEGQRPFSNVPNLTYRTNKTVVNPLARPCSTLDYLNYTRLDLVTRGVASVFKRANLPVCRGCVYNCLTCGGSAYSYEKMFGREKPAFRSPNKILEDLEELGEQGVRAVFLFQDARMGGRRYWNELVTALKSDRSKIETITMELFEPPPSEFLESLAPLRDKITLTMSPESGDDEIRRAQGRPYTNQEILSLANACRRLGLRLTVFFMLGLAGENRETMEKTYGFWEEFYSPASRLEGVNKGKGVARHAMGSMVLLDPGSLAFDYPEKYGYKLHFKSLYDYIEGLSKASWHQWISYETNELDRAHLARLMLDSFLESTRIREKYGAFITPEQAVVQYFQMNLNRMIIDELDHAMRLVDKREKINRLNALNTSFKSVERWLVSCWLDNSLLGYPELSANDQYGYSAAIRSAMLESIGLLEASE